MHPSAKNGSAVPNSDTEEYRVLGRTNESKSPCAAMRDDGTDKKTHEKIAKLTPSYGGLHTYSTYYNFLYH